MKILLVYARFPVSYWGFQHTLPITGARASLPPLGLLTLAALLPRHWQLELVDLNVADLTDAEISWADMVLVGGMLVQIPSMLQVVDRARQLGRKTMVGGPGPSATPEAFVAADYVFVGEAEARADAIVATIEAACEGAGTCKHPRVLDNRELERPPLSLVPIPRFDLLKRERYASMSLQYSRGCPYTCEFCDVIELFGRVPRVKASSQVLAELDALKEAGYRGSVFFVDDNFISNKRSVKALLPQVQAWQAEHGHPFEFYTEASINLANDPKLVDEMVSAGFSTVFVGVETPSARALAAAHKTQNLDVDLKESIDYLTRSGLEVMAGFIIGFDDDDAAIFELQRKFIASTPIPLAMIGLLTALPGTGLWRRLHGEGRLRTSATGDHFGRPNFVPKLDEEVLLTGYRDLLLRVYDSRAYVQRCRAFLRMTKGVRHAGRVLRLNDYATLLRAIVALGIRSENRHLFWSLVTSATLHSPPMLAWGIAHAIMGEHMLRYTHEDVLPRIDEALRHVREQRRAGVAAVREHAAS